MRAGKLDREITVQRSAVAVNDFGVPVTTWTDVCAVRAQVIQQTTEEFIRGYGATDDAVVVFRTRWIDDLTAADRIAFEGENYNIKELKPIGRRKGVDIRAVVE